MSNFPSDFDDDTTLPVVNNNITEIGDDAINALREAVFNIEQNIGLLAAGSSGSISNRLSVCLLPDGTIKPSVITNLGFVTYGGGGITNAEVNANAAIIESKLKLDHRTQDLFNYITDLSSDVNTSVGWISTEGVKLEPHLSGITYRHTLDQIDVAANPNLFLKNKLRQSRDNSNSYQLVNDINNEFLFHQWADGSLVENIQNIITVDGSIYPSNYAHTASGIFLNTSRFSSIPETAQDLQSFAEFLDSSSIFLYGTRIQNLYSNGISKVSRSSNLAIDGYGPSLVPTTPAIAYLLDGDVTSYPFDDIDAGDDIIEFKPSNDDRNSYFFDEKFALVKPGDLIRINYGTIEVSFIIKEKKYQSDPNPLFNRYLVRIAGKNLMYAANATARIDKSLVNTNKFGVLAIGSAQILSGGTNVLSSPALPSLTIGTPRGAMALGLGFNSDQFDSTHYNLYLALFTTGLPQDGYTILPAIDVTGNGGATPGKYTLSSIVETINQAFRQPGFNYRFLAFSYKGELGIMLSDSYNNVAFSIISAAVSSNGTYDQSATNLNLPNNVISVFSNDNSIPSDPLGFGSNGSNIASPPYMTSYGSSAAASLPTKLFTALKRNTYYIDGAEKDKLNLESGQILDVYGDGYWAAIVDGYTVIPGSPPSGRVQMSYNIPLDLESSNLKIGKTIVVQADGYGLITSGRFIIEDISFSCSPTNSTIITVYDAVHATGISPTTTLPIGSPVKIYFNSDSVSFNQESATDFGSYLPFKRHFEIYTDSEGNTFTHERGRVYIGGTSAIINGVTLSSSVAVNNFDIIRISPKLRGYQFGTVTKISLRLFNYDQTTGLYDGYLATTSDYVNFTNSGQHIYGKIGETVRFYDESNIDYIDIILNIDSGQNSFSNITIDFQLFPSLSLDDQIMIIGTCQINDTTRSISQVRDERSFGNTSEKEFSNSALDLISSGERLLHGNGVINGFDLGLNTNTSNGKINLTGGTVLVNGKFIQINAQTVIVPPVAEKNLTLFDINWALCINSDGEYHFIPLLDKFGVNDVSAGGTGSTDRIFMAYNIVNGNFYTLDSSTFGNIIANRKDLTILYVVKSHVSTGPNFALTISDARKFIYNETVNNEYTWVPEDADRPNVTGNFKNLDSIVTWVNMYGADKTTLIKVKGSFIVDSPFILSSIRNKVIFEGNGAEFNVISSIGFQVKNNITFKNITFNYDPNSFAVSGNINGNVGCIFGEILTSTAGQSIENIIVENCIFNSSTTNHPPFICFRLAPDLVNNTGGYIRNIRIINNQFNDTTDHPAAIAFINTYQDDTNSNQSAAALCDVLIENNYCNQNQIFYFASTFIVNEGGAGDTPGMVAFNVVVRNNKMGAVAYSTSGSVNFSSSITQKEMGFVIEDNRCVTVISPIDQTGTVPLNYLTLIRANYNRFVGTGIVTIRNNNLAYISVVNRRAISASFPATMVISGNRLCANDYANNVKAIFNFDASVDTFVLGTGTTYGVAIYVDHTTINTSEAAIGTIIENNVITNNAYNSGLNINDSGFIKRFYEGGIFSYIPAIIRNNHISGFAGEAKIGTSPRTFGIVGSIFSNSYSGGATPNQNYYIKANNNFIYRGGDSGIDLRAYISGCNEVTDNFFDSSFCDSALTNTSVVLSGADGDYRNKHEIYTIEIRSQDTGRILGANNLTFNFGIDNRLIGYVENLVAPANTGNPYKSGVDAAAVSIDSIQHYTSDVLTAGSTSDGQLHVNCATGIKKVWIVSLDEFIPKNAALYSVSTTCKISGGSGNKIATLALVSEGASGVDFSYAYGTVNVSASTLSPITTLAINTISYPYTNLKDISLGKCNIMLLMDATAVNATFFFSNLIIKYIY